MFLSYGTAPAADPCLDCHEKKTPGIVDYWKGSAHFKEASCDRCHGKSVEDNHSRKSIVTAEVCGSCHNGAFVSHKQSKHSIGLKTGRGCTRSMHQSEEQQRSCALCHEPGSSVPIVETECAMFLAQSPEMQRQGCDACHNVEVRCDGCHGKHGTDVGLAGEAGTCGVCHMGPDHAQYEMWKSSMHGVIYQKEGKKSAPTCVTCHMKGGTHDVSMGIATGINNADQWAKQREYMIAICSACHTPSLSRRNLSDADAIQAQSLARLEEAQKIIRDLYEDGLLKPMPAERPGHPIFGSKFVIGPHMLYENISDAEAVFFRMMMFYYMSSFKGAFHQNPDYAHWYGNAPLKLSLSELKSKDALLRGIDRLNKRLDNLGSSITGRQDGKGLREKLMRLKESFLKGDLSEERYREQKNRLLDEAGL